jgi:hypothetical protein
MMLRQIWFAVTHPRHFYRIVAWTTLRQTSVRQPSHPDPLVDMFYQGAEYLVQEQRWRDLHGKQIPLIRIALHAWKPKVFRMPASAPTWIAASR